MKNRKSSKMLYLLLLLMFTTIMLSTSTYAWFTSNRVVTINSINVHVAASGGIEISADGSNWKSVIFPEDLTSVHDTTYPTSVNQIPGIMEPVSTGKEIDTSKGFLKMYYGTTDNNETGDYILTSVRSVEEEGNGETSNGKFIAFDLFFKVNKETPIYMTNNSKVTYTDEDGKGIAAATRIAFLDEGTTETGTDLASIQGLKEATSARTYIWEPNYDVHTPAAVANAYDVYGITTRETNAPRIIYDGVINEIGIENNVLLKKAKSSIYPNLFKTVNVDYYTEKDFTDYQPVFTLRPGITKIRVYMWIEGQDVDCENNASYDDIQFDLQFTVNPA